LLGRARLLADDFDGAPLFLFIELGRVSAARVVIEPVKLELLPPIEPKADAVAVNLIDVSDLINRVTTLVRARWRVNAFSSADVLLIS
jgi:hypothetical protein